MDVPRPPRTLLRLGALVVLLAALAPIALPARPAMACYCTSDVTARADVVFTGRVLNDARTGEAHLIEVLEPTRGVDTPVIEVRDAEGDCHVGFAARGTYFIAAKRDSAGGLWTANCASHVLERPVGGANWVPIPLEELSPAPHAATAVLQAENDDDDAEWWAYPVLVVGSLAAAGFVFWAGSRR